MRLFGPRFLMDKAGEGGTGGGAGDGDLKAEFEAMKAENDKIKAELASFKSKPGDEPDLAKKAELEKKDNEDKKQTTRRQESAVRFNITVGDFVKTNKDALPLEVEDILKQADKENFDTEFQKSRAIKVGLVQSFFKLKENHDRLTVSQKSTIDRFLNLTKNGKEEEVEAVWENVFEPALEVVKAYKKADEVSKAKHGHATGTSGEAAYIDRLMKHSRKTLLGEK